LVAVLFVALAVTCCGWAGVTISTVPRAHAADANYLLIQVPDTGYSPIIGLISSAARSVRVTMYELTDAAAVSALIDAHRRGVDTKVILDAAFHGRDTNAETFQELTEAGVGVKWADVTVTGGPRRPSYDAAPAQRATGQSSSRIFTESEPHRRVGSLWF
jgi:cardiolipin synthase